MIWHVIVVVAVVADKWYDGRDDEEDRENKPENGAPPRLVINQQSLLVRPLDTDHDTQSSAANNNNNNNTTGPNFKKFKKVQQRQKNL